MSESPQIRNSMMVNTLSGEVQLRYDPAFSWKTAESQLMALPAVRAVWTMGSVDYQQPECTDASGHGYDLQAAGALGNVDFGYDPTPALPPVAIFGGGANQYLLRADGGAGNWADITGGESYIQATQLGLSLGGWFYVAALPSAVTYLMAKDDGGANRQYRLTLTAGNLLNFEVWAGPVSVQSTATIIAGWNHCVGTYDQPSQTLYVVLNGVVTAGVGGAAPAALVDTGAPFTIGADGAGANRLTGRASMCWLSAASLRQGGYCTHAVSLCHQQAAMYKVSP